MIKRYIIPVLVCCFSHFTLIAQTGDDGLNSNVIHSFANASETARVSVSLMPGFSTSGNTFHAFISPDIQYHNAIVQTNGDFDQNFIRVYQPKADNATTAAPAHLSLDYAKWFESVSYFDGLGRLSQSINVKSMPNGSDLVVPVKYDNMGRQSYQYLPYCIIQDGANGAGGYRVYDVAEQQDFNNYFFKDEGTYAKSIQTYEPSPLDRIAQTIGPGKDWQTTGSEKPVKILYETNIASDIHLFSVNNSNELSRSGYYPAATLYKTRQLDENNNETSEYKNLQGLVIAKTATVDGGKATTYYVYNDFGYLRYVVPPLASDLVPATVATYNLLTDWVKNYCYYYEYADTRKRMTTKKLPGCDPVYMVYNKRDLLVLSQDGNQRLTNQWSFIKYDKFNRPILTGIYTHSTAINQSAMQALVDPNSNYYEQFSTSNADPGYTSVAYPTTGYEIQTVTYYDNYGFLSVAGNTGDYAFKATEMDFVNGESASTKGMVTGTRSKVTETTELSPVIDNKLLSVNRYDKYGRLIQTTADNHLGGKNITSIKYNFTGQILKTKDNHINTSATVDVNQRNEYDNGGRLTNAYYKIGSSPEILMTQNVYNELGQAKQKKLHGSGSAFVQTEDFQYNIRGWLEKINDVNKPGSDFFAFGLNYTARSQYNGNISSMEWVSKQFPALKSYAFTYDELNRVKTAAYSPSAYYNENVTYDKNGNIKTLNRIGQTATDVYGPIDDLAYNYSGNQLNNVNDNAGTAYQNNGFSDNGSNTTNEYLYDPNGNLVKDLNKHIESIQYTPQNLPCRIAFPFAKSSLILFAYDATGRKLCKQIRQNQAIMKTTDYDGSFVYEDGSLSYIITPEGRALPDGTSYKYEYYLKDHLGNTRVAFDQNGTVLQDNSYYPFGMSIDGLNYTNTAQSTPNKYLYNGKMMQDEMGLGWLDYGARFYDPVLGRFNTQDRFSEKYMGLTPYHYGANNPIKFIDINGDSSVVLLKFGHMAQLIQDENGKYKLWSKNGTRGSSRLSGENMREDRGDNKDSKGYDTPQEFLDSKENKDEKTGEPEYKEGYLIPATSPQDRQNEEGTKEELKKDYNIVKSNCVQTVQNGLRKEGKQDGSPSTWSQISATLLSGTVGQLYNEKTPAKVYNRIKTQNPGGIVFKPK